MEKQIINQNCPMLRDELCGKLRDVDNLKPSKNTPIDKQVAIFLHILAHDMKNKVMIWRHYWSISQYCT